MKEQALAVQRMQDYIEKKQTGAPVYHQAQSACLRTISLTARKSVARCGASL